jgi:hypothetical protein
MTDTTRQILLTLSWGGWHDLSARYSQQSISSLMTRGLIRQDHPGRPIIGAMFTITPRGEAAIKGDV